MRRAAQANWSHLPNRNRPRFYTAWTQSGHALRAPAAGRPYCATPLCFFPSHESRVSGALACCIGSSASHGPSGALHPTSCSVLPMASAYTSLALKKRPDFLLSGGCR